jgi:branched-chain amino acid transport system substrate-binding protein
MKNILIIGTLLLLLLTACTEKTLTGKATQPEPQRPIVIGGAFSLTGDASDWGQDEYKAAQLAVDEANAEGGVNGTPITLVAEDTATDGKTTLSAATKLIDVDHVPAIVGPTWGDSFAQIEAPTAEEAHVVQITPSGAIEVAEQSANYTYFYSTFFTIPQEIQTHMAYLKQHNFTKAIVIRDQDPFNTKMVEEYKLQAKKDNVAIVGEFVIQDDKDYRTVLLKAKQLDADVLFVETLNVGDMGAMMKAMDELGMKEKFTSTASAQTNTLLESFAPYAEGRMIYSSPDLHSKAFQQFEQRFASTYGKPPSGSTAAGAYDATRAIIAAMRNGARTGLEIKQQLDEMRINGTIVDTLQFNSMGGVDGWKFEMKTVKNGQYVEFEPAR